jgi:hypothetical protein
MRSRRELEFEKPYLKLFLPRAPQRARRETVVGANAP